METRRRDCAASAENGSRQSTLKQCRELRSIFASRVLLAKHNFIWICMSCGRSYFRPKSTVLERLTDPELLRAYEACADMQLIQGIDMCIECDPECVVEHVAGAKKERIAGSC